MDRRDALKLTGAALAGAALTPAQAMIWRGGSAATAPTRPLGMNLAQLVNYTTQQPFLNLLKSGGGSSSQYTGWQTSKAGTWDTSEEGYLQLDSDGYVTSLTASPTPAGGQLFTYVQTLVQYNMGTPPPGASLNFPAGPYRFQCTGPGTITFSGGAITALSNAVGCTIAGLAVTSTSNTGTWSVDVAIPNPNAVPTGGIVIEVTAIPSGPTFYPKAMSLVNTAFTAAFDAGAIFHPTFLSTLNGITSLRFMDWLNTNNELTGYTVSGTIASGATSAPLSSVWTRAGGTYSVLFIDGEQRNAVFTTGATTMDWSADGRGGLANAITSTTWGTQNCFCNFWVINKNWANRSLPSNCFWSTYAGIPWEICVALCNQLSADIEPNVPLMYSDSDIQALAALIVNGTGMQAGFSALSSAQRVLPEFSNEVWNSQFSQYNAAGSLGGFTWPSQASGGGNYTWNRNYFGMRTALMAQDFQTAVGSAFSRVIPVLGAQAAGTNSADIALKATYWTTGSGAPSTYPIKAVAIAPYFPSTQGSMSTGDSNTITSQSDGGVSYLIQCMTTNVMTGGSAPGTLSSVPSNGYAGQAQGYVTTYLSYLSANYPSLALIGYEGGQQLVNSLPGGAPLPGSLVNAANRSSGMGTVYYNFLKWWSTNVGGTSANILHLYNDCYYSAGGQNSWGDIESVMQTRSPLSSAPAKWQAVQNYVTGN